MAKEFKLIPAEIPGRRARGTDLYEKILEEFSKGAADSVRIEVSDRKPGTIRIGLLKALKSGGFKVAVHMRGNDVYLEKK